MFYKKNFLFLLLISMHNHATELWISRHIAHLNLIEQKLILTTLEAAIKRCQSLIQIQEVSEKLVEFVHNETQFLADTRLRPAQCITAINISAEIVERWMQNKQLYKNNCIVYDHCVSQVDAKQELLEAFNYVRQEARSAVLKATAYESYRLKEYALSLTEYGQKTLTSLQLLQKLLGKRSMLDDLTQWVTSLLITPFIQCNDQIILVHDQAWELVKKQEIFGNHIWKIIEEARLKTYTMYYHAIKKQMKDTMHEN